LRRRLRSAERLSEAAMRLGSLPLNTPFWRSSASLSRVTRPDQYRVFFRGAALRRFDLRGAVFRLDEVRAIFSLLSPQPKVKIACGGEMFRRDRECGAKCQLALSRLGSGSTASESCTATPTIGSIGASQGRRLSVRTASA
jgi:hypothetical protein